VGGKVTDENGDLLFEFEDGQPVAHFLKTLIMKAKFGEKFDPLITFHDGWAADLLQACHAKSTPVQDTRVPSAPKYFLDDGMTQSDWDLKDFFHDITAAITHVVGKGNWAQQNRDGRENFIKNAIAPHPISDARIRDMIEDIDIQLKAYAAAYNPEFNASK